MRRSIRLRLQAWYGLVLLGVISGFAGILYYSAKQSRWREVDNALDAAAHYLDVTLRQFPPHELDSAFPPGPGPPPLPPPGEGEDNVPEGQPAHAPRTRARSAGSSGPRRAALGAAFLMTALGAGLLTPTTTPARRPSHAPAPPSRDARLSELTFPRRPGPPRRDDPSEEAYFGIWQADGTPVKTLHLPSGILPPELDAPPGPGMQWLRRGEAREVAMRGPMRTRILVGKSVRREEDELRRFAWQLAAAGGLVLAVGLSGVGGSPGASFGQWPQSRPRLPLFPRRTCRSGSI